MKLGVFDSGLGGEAVAESLRDAFPDTEILTVNDGAHVPYGDRTADDITRLTDTAIQPLLKAGCNVIVIACNTATAASIESLRERYPTQTFVGLEPMVKPAVERTKTGVIAICATPATLASERYSRLKRRYAADVTVIEPDCGGWAHMIEHDNLEEAVIRDTVRDLLADNVDVIVLACTHYHWIRDVIEQHAGTAVVLDPSDAIVRRVMVLLGKQV